MSYNNKKYTKLHQMCILFCLVISLLELIQANFSLVVLACKQIFEPDNTPSWCWGCVQSSLKGKLLPAADNCPWDKVGFIFPRLIIYCQNITRRKQGKTNINIWTFHFLLGAISIYLYFNFYVLNNAVSTIVVKLQ